MTAMNQACRVVIFLLSGAIFSPDLFSPNHRVLAQSIVPAADGTDTIVTPEGQRLEIRGGTQSDSNLFHSFERFNLSADQTALFLANPQIQNILGRVTGGEASIINGLIQVSGGNANLVLMNPAGILFGTTAQLNVPASFTATTATGIGFGHQDWFQAIGANDYARLVGTPNRFAIANSGAIFNAGNLSVSSGQALSLFGGTVVNVGTLNAPNGRVAIAALENGKQIRITPEGSLLSLDLPSATASSISPKSLPALLTGGQLNNATQVTIENGVVKIGQTPTPTKTGTAIVSGTTIGNSIQVAAERIALLDAAIYAGERVLIGGDRQGQGEFPRSQVLFGNANTRIQANAQNAEVILWSDQATRFYGAIAAPNQGFIETSGQRSLDVTGAKINAGNGTWLLDPSDINITSGGTGALTLGVFDPLSATATIDPATIVAALDAGTNVTITTANGTGGNGVITLNSLINQTGGGTASLTLIGRRFIRSNTTDAIINLNSSGALTFDLNRVNPEANPPVDSIQDAIDAIGVVNGNRIIQTGSGTYRGTVFLNKNVNLVGTDFNSTILSGENLNRAIVVDSGVIATIRNVAVTNGRSPAGESGGGILNLGDLTVANSRIFNNVAQQDGGGISSFGANSRLAIVENTRIENNTALFGGGISNTNGVITTINTSLIRNNNAVEGGGGIENTDGSQLTILNSGIDNNSAKYGAGITLFQTGTVLIDGSSISNNIANGNAGGINNENNLGSIAVTRSSISNNVSGLEGGAVFNTGTMSLSAGFINNRAEFRGGAIKNTPTGTLNLQGSFLNNLTRETGGAIDNQGRLDISFALFEGNVADGALNPGGGAIQNAGANGIINISETRFQNNRSVTGGAIDNTFSNSITLNRVQFIENFANGEGGAILTDRTTQLTITETQFLRNIANTLDGGAIYASGVSTLENVVFDGNRAGNTGGGIHNIGALTLNNNTFTANSSGFAGGGIRNENTAIISNSQFNNNSSAYAGGVSNIVGANATINTSRFANNIATINGGAIANDSRMSVSQSTFTNNQAIAEKGGAISTEGNLTIAQSTFTGNTTGSFGGAIASIIPANSAGTPEVVITNTSLIANRANSGGAISHELGTLTLDSSTIANNTAIADGGGITSAAGNLIIRNSTISGNTASNSGGFYIANGNINLFSSTITNNNANTGGILNDLGIVNAQNTIIAGNLGTANPDVFGAFNDLGNNLIGISDGSTGFVISSLVGSAAFPIDPLLGALANNGGFTQTHALLAGSPALNAGNNAGATSTIDQRGLPRIQQDTIDIGAVESETPAISEPPTSQPPTTSNPQPPTTSNPQPPTTSNPLPSLNSTDTTLQRNPSPILRPNTENQQIISTAIDIDRSLSNDFVEFFGLQAAPDLTIEEIQTTLAKAQRQRQIRSAVIYAIFVPKVITPTSKTGEPLADQVEPITPLLRSRLKRDDDRLELILITGTGRAIRYSTETTRAQVIEQAKLYRLAASDIEDDLTYQALSKQLFRWLVKPLEADLQREKITSLIYCFDEGLRTLPIAAMSDDRGFVIDRYAVSVIPSMALINRDIVGLSDRTMLAMGADQFRSLEPLPAVPTELQLVSEQFWKGNRFLNQAFTVDRLREEKQRLNPGIIHLATHARFKPGSPDQSYIQFWDRQVTLAEMKQFEWSNPPLQLLVLSACDTAIGSREAELGFAGITAAAGVHTVLGSLWTVSDIGTLALMSEFYIQLQQSPTRAQALQRAQAALRTGIVRIENGVLITSQTQIPLPKSLLQSNQTVDFRHPFYWAAFTLVGNPW